MNTEISARRAFVGGALQYARTLPMREAERFLKGLLLVAGEQDEIEPLRACHNEIRHLNEHLDLCQLELFKNREGNAK